MKIKGFLAKISWTLGGNLVYSFSQFLILTIIAKVDGPKDVGVFTLSLAICSPVFLFLNLKIRSVLITDLDDKYNFTDYRMLRLITSVVSVVLVILIGIFAKYHFYVTLIIIIMSFAKLIEMQSDLNYGVFQKNQRFDLMAKSIMIRGILNLIFPTTVLLITKSLLLAVILILVSNLCAYYFYDQKHIVNYTNIKEKLVFRKQKIKSLFILAFPLGVSTLIGSLNTNIPRYIIEHKLGLYELGIFSGITYLLVVGNMFLSAVSQVLMPKLSTLFFRKEYSKFKTLLSKMMLVGFMVGIFIFAACYFFGDYILTLLYSKEYASYKNILLIISAGIILLYSTVFLGTAITAMKLFKVQPFIQLFSLVILGISSYLLINLYGLTGAAISLVLSYFGSAIAYIFVIIINFRKRSEYRSEAA